MSEGGKETDWRGHSIGLQMAGESRGVGGLEVIHLQVR